MLVLGIETSCDETSVALVEAQQSKIHLINRNDDPVSRPQQSTSPECSGSSNIESARQSIYQTRSRIRVIDQLTASQIEEHRPFGGVVPEVATRQHLLHLPRLTQKLLERNALAPEQIGALGITHGPGLASSLMIGLSFGKAMAMALDCPWVGVNHLEGHIFSAFLPQEKFPDQPHIALIVSGGHTLLIAVTPPFQYKKLGGTLDDAAGEAFDKTAKMLGLDYPGGPEIEKCAKSGNPHAIHFPRAMLNKDSRLFAESPADGAILRQQPPTATQSIDIIEEASVGPTPKAPTGHGLCQEFNFSFSGLKTSLRVYLTKHPDVLTDNQKRADACASIQQAIVDVLTEKARRACLAQEARLLTLSGGVSCNGPLRQAIEAMCKREGIECLLSPPTLATDNAAMIAAVAAARLLAGQRAPWALDIDPNLKLV